MHENAGIWVECLNLMMHAQKSHNSPSIFLKVDNHYVLPGISLYITWHYFTLLYITLHYVIISWFVANAQSHKTVMDLKLPSKWPSQTSQGTSIKRGEGAMLRAYAQTLPGCPKKTWPTWIIDYHDPQNISKPLLQYVLCIFVQTCSPKDV